jgi:hypothetical protein
MMAGLCIWIKEASLTGGSSVSRSRLGGGEEHSGGVKVLDCRRYGGFARRERLEAREIELAENNKSLLRLIEMPNKSPLLNFSNLSNAY